jgi:quinol monooxygenase YgiN
MVTLGMVIVAGHLHVDPAERDRYLATCVEVVRLAREAPGCLDFALSPDLVDPGRINILERWDSQDAVEAFRGSGVDDEQGAMILGASVAEYGAVEERVLSHEA